VRLGTRVLLTAVFIALYAGAFPPGGVPYLAWVAPVPYLVALRGARVRDALLLGWLSAFAVAVWITDFLPRAITTYYQQNPLFGAVLFTLVVTAMCCPFHMLFSAWYARLDLRRGAGRVLLVGAAWAAAEYGRGVVGGNPWGLFAYSQAHLPRVIQVADLTGPYGVSFVLIVVGAALADLVGRDAGRPAVAGLVAAGGVAALSLAYGAARLAGASPAAAGGAATEVAVVQPNLDLGFQWRDDLLGANLGLELRLTREAWEASRPRLVVWPESALTFFVEREAAYRAAMAAVLAPRDLQLVAGGVRAEGRRFFNAAFVVEPDGRVAASADKEVLVPFAEYFPLASVQWLNRRFGRVQQFSAGAPAAPLPTVAGPAAVVICNEALLPEVVRARVRRGGELIVNLANDGWLGSDAFSRRVLDVTLFRAVEMRRYLVRASTSGTSSVIDPWGRVVVEAPPFVETFVSAAVRRSAAASVYNRVGDLFALVCVAAVLAELTTRSARRRRGAG
jgi:apolipoprotein N-acyltransferase